MTTLLLSQRYSADSNRLWQAAIARGWQTHRVQGLRLHPDDLPPPPYVLYGETLLADALAEVLPFDLLEPDDDFLPDLPPEYRLRSIQHLPLSRARRLPGPLFLKPVDEKWFPASVYEDPSAAGEDLAAEAPVLASAPVRFMVEFRCFVVDRVIVGLSPYIREGRIAQDASGAWEATEQELLEAGRFAARVVGDPRVRLPRAVVVDVGRLDDGRWAVVEANPIWGAGLCGVHAETILDGLALACRAHTEITEDDRPFLRSLHQQMRGAVAG